jgi:hypothetical protein
VICGWLRERWVSLKKEKRAVGKKIGGNCPGFQFHCYLWLCLPPFCMLSPSRGLQLNGTKTYAKQVQSNSPAGIRIIDYSGNIFSLKVFYYCQAILDNLDILKAQKTFLCC